jgi:hypothetical protein
MRESPAQRGFRRSRVDGVVVSDEIAIDHHRPATS